MAVGRRWALAASLLLAGCGSSYRSVADTPVRIGPPYVVRGVTYTPAAAPGYASWYGHESGDCTASGEHFRARAMGAAHPTLPLPTYLEVTALATGRVVLVRVNDRGPFARGRIVDLSRGAARALELDAGAPAAVRIRAVAPSEADRAALRRGHAARPRPDADALMLARLDARLDASTRRSVDLLTGRTVLTPTLLRAAPAASADGSTLGDARDPCQCRRLCVAINNSG